MEQLDRAASAKILHLASAAGVSIDELAVEMGISQAVLVKRLTVGPWRLSDLAIIAKVIGCRTVDLVPDEAAA
jgi:lambda repressor-like predicted transcriptional regulator